MNADGAGNTAEGYEPRGSRLNCSVLIPRCNKSVFETVSCDFLTNMVDKTKNKLWILFTLYSVCTSIFFKSLLSCTLNMLWHGGCIINLCCTSQTVKLSSIIPNHGSVSSQCEILYTLYHGTQFITHM